jgi:hypothetical protein
MERFEAHSTIPVAVTRKPFATTMPDIAPYTGRILADYPG